MLRSEANAFLLLTLAVMPLAGNLLLSCTTPEPARTTSNTHPGRLLSVPGCLAGRAALPAEAPAAGPLSGQPGCRPQRRCSSAARSTQAAAASRKQLMGSRWDWGCRWGSKGEWAALAGPLGAILPAFRILSSSSSYIYARIITGSELSGSGRGKAAPLLL